MVGGLGKNLLPRRVDHLAATDGRYEPFKTTEELDNTARNPHGLGEKRRG